MEDYKWKTKHLTQSLIDYERQSSRTHPHTTTFSIFRRPVLLASVLLLVLASVCVLYSLHTRGCHSYRVFIDIETADNHLSSQPPLQSDPSLLFTRPSADTDTLVQKLKNIKFLNYGITSHTYDYVWDTIECEYLETQNVTGPYICWTQKDKANYLYRSIDGKLFDPPSGMRSSMPLGGISTGVFELRGDGKFHELTIFNQHPAGAAKIQVMDDMFMAISTKETSNTSKAQSLVLQTHPYTDGLPGVHGLEYRGSYPVSKLTVEDTRLPIDVSVYAYSRYKFNDMNTSATPAVAFTAVFDNSGPNAVERTASFMINLPVGMEFNTQRTASPLPRPPDSLTHNNFQDKVLYDDIKDSLPQNPVKSFKLTSKSVKDMELECFQKCASSTESCQSWSLNIASSTCITHPDHVRLNGYKEGSTSGVKTSWITDSECVTANRDTPGYNTNGNISLCAFSSDKDVKLSMHTGNDIVSLWEDFSSTGQFSAASEGPFVSGAVSGQVTLKPNESKEVTIVLGWYFPDRDFLGIPVGNFYTHLVDNSTDAARKLGNNVQNAVSDISKLHSTFFGSSVSETLQDMLINSLSHIRSAFWLKDGRWRQWEAPDCVNIDSVHNDGERHIPYIMVFPDSVKNKMRAWASFQLPNGMIQEQLRCGCMTLPLNPVTVEFGCGRVMSDVSSMFIVYLLELLQWDPNPQTNEFVKELWPNAKKAAQWHIDISVEHGLPRYLVSTYDIIDLQAYPYATYNSAFHLLALKAAQRLALWMGDTDFANSCEENFLIGQETMDELLWNKTAQYYNAYSTTEEEFDKETYFTDLNMNLCSYPEYHKEEWGECVEGYPTTPGAIMTDTFYAQVLAYSLGLGVLVKDENKLRQHMKAELEYSSTNLGMVVVTGRFLDSYPFQDSAIWMMGNANWATINLHLGEDVQSSLDVVHKSFDHWRTSLNEIWNVAGILSSGSYTQNHKHIPYITSHYGYYMSSWHILFGLSGQDVDVNEKRVSFSPRLEAPFELPFMLPTVWGQLVSKLVQVDSGKTVQSYTLSVEFGELEILTMSSGSCHKTDTGGKSFQLNPATPATWNCTITT